MRWALAATPLLFLGCGLFDGGVLDSGPEAGADVITMPDVITQDVSVDGGTDAPIDTGFDAPPLAPDNIPGLVFWLRGDRGVDIADAGPDGEALVATWHDQSDAGDPNHTANQITPALQPSLLAQDPQFANNATVQFFAYQRLVTGTWNTTVGAPATMFVVGKSTAIQGTYGYFVDSITASPRMAILCSPQSQNRVQLVGAGLMETAVTGKCDSAASIIGIFDGPSSGVYVSSKQFVPVTGVGASGWAGATIGNNFQSGIGYAPRGPIAEIALWPRRLTVVEIEGLQKYSGARYGIAIQ
jgi:hypothetical protein